MTHPGSFVNFIYSCGVLGLLFVS